MKTVQITKKEMENTLFKIFIKHNFPQEKAKLLSEVFTENSLSGVTSHGINRVPLFTDYVKKNLINKDSEAEKKEVFGSLERWDGNNGPGIINAVKCTNRAIELAKANGIGLVALRNTNHWMRGGYYGWQAANHNCISILFTNTKPNMPAWGGKELKLGNNPFIISIPRKEGHVVLDMAISQFSFGKINDYKLKGEELPFEGGWDNENKLTKNPEHILESERSLPIGYWKGSALSMVLDMLATILSAGKSTFKLGLEEFETGVSQIFICLDKKTFNDSSLQEKLLNEIIDFTHKTTPNKPGEKTYYPGERSLKARRKNLNKGIPVNTTIWNTILEIENTTIN
ncbi:3-dehydro-L-gulonate 2-dehydrogenase [uncultured Algibacter sp.]|uniref:3-dehydro-L-gulonate 2-dehydrogenase n=1 Tax=uncultured Algibacter sp. TaxID=298659 RepID=UPI002634DC0E|nr:3-dehydro-L-gulonate 2-dehydrogenase [uncultured Algibacter sp.]